MDKKVKNKLEALRKQVDRADQNLLIALCRRLRVVKKIGILKARAGVPVLGKERWEKLIEKRMLWAKKNGISKSLVQNIYNSIHTDSIKIQKAIKRR